ncbi:CELLULOSE SYNTHASE INTERACTIVE 3-like protein [Drosera capensis]
MKLLASKTQVVATQSARALGALSLSAYQAEFQDTEVVWISAMLQRGALFQDREVVSAPDTMRIIPFLAILLKSDEMIDRYFAAQAMASLTLNGSKGIILVRNPLINGAIARSSAAARIVDPLFQVLIRPDFSPRGQHSALQALVNILEQPQSLATLELTPSQVVEPLIAFLESSSQGIQQLSTELLSYLLAQGNFQQDFTTKNDIVPLVQLCGIRILNLQQTAVIALEKISVSWPKAVADAGGIFELSKLIVEDDPQPPRSLLESAALVLSNVLHSSVDYYFEVPLERRDAHSAEFMAEADAIDALVELLSSHHCEETVGRLLEALFNNVRVREMKAAKYAIAPLSQYLLDPNTRASDSVSACRALIGLLKDQPTDEMKMVAICALQNFVIHSRSNRLAVAEAGRVLVIQEHLLSSNSEVAIQAALLIRFLFSNHTLLEYVSNELIRSLTAALERELWSSATTNEEQLKTLNVIFTNFPKVYICEAATLCIPHLVSALKSGSEAAQDTVLETLCLLQQSWSTMPIEFAKSQSVAAAEAIPILQMLLKTCPPSFHERADSLLHCLPGCLTVTIQRGKNLKQSMANANAFLEPFCFSLFFSLSAIMFLQDGIKHLHGLSMYLRRDKSSMSFAKQRIHLASKLVQWEPLLAEDHIALALVALPTFPEVGNYPVVVIEELALACANQRRSSVVCNMERISSSPAAAPMSENRKIVDMG